MPYLDPIQMAALYDTGNLLHATLELNEVLKQATALGLRVMRAQRCICFLFDERHTQTQAGPSLREEGANELNPTLARLLKTTRESAQPTHLSGLAADSQWQPFEVGALMLAPLKVDETVLGALYVDRAPDAQPFGESDLNLGEAYAAQVGLAVRNAQAYAKATQAK